MRCAAIEKAHYMRYDYIEAFGDWNGLSDKTDKGSSWVKIISFMIVLSDPVVMLTHRNCKPYRQ